MKTKIIGLKPGHWAGGLAFWILLGFALVRAEMPISGQAVDKPSYIFTTLAGGSQANSHGWPFKPTSVAVDTAGNLYFADALQEVICRMAPSGAVTILAGQADSIGSADGPGAQARFRYPRGVALDAAGNLYVADCGNSTIRRITPAGVVTTIAGLAAEPGNADGRGCSARFNYPYSIALDGAGDLYVADLFNCDIRKMTPDGSVTTFAGLSGISGSRDGRGDAARFNFPISLAVDGSGNVYVADMLNNAIRKITPDGLVITLAGNLAYDTGNADGTGSTARFCHPCGLAVDSGNNIYVADAGNQTIRCITPAGVVTTLAGLAGQSGSADGTASVARFWHPAGLALDHLGNLYVTDQGNAAIRKGSAEPSTNTAISLNTK
jgi:DNA-binding beta-propeller fold protein YncE